MPGLGDALSKAMEESRRGPEALVRRAASGESDADQTDVTSLAPALQPAGGPESGGAGPVSREEQDMLVVALDPGPGAAVPEPDGVGTEVMPKTQVLPTPQNLPMPAGQPAEPPPAAEPVAPFAPSGVIRRQLRRPSGAPSDGELLGSAAGRRSLADELPGCRRLPALPGVDPFRSPALIKGVGGAVRAIVTGKAGRPALVAFCGAAEGAGSTTVAVAVALELAIQARLRVLLVDADFRSPGLGGLVGEAEGSGFSEVLAGGAKLDAAVVLSPVECLAVLPLGRAGAAAGDSSGVARLLEGPALGRMLDACRGLFDAVIFDAGSAAGWPGPAGLAGAAGTAVLVIRAGRTGAREVRAVRRTLERFGARVAGAVLNCAPAGAER